MVDLELLMKARQILAKAKPNQPVLPGPAPSIQPENSSSPVDAPPSPLPPHCFATYTDSTGRLRGGWDERTACTVKQCLGVGADCKVELSNGATIPLRAIRAVGQLSAEGRLIAAWTVREHGYNGDNGEAMTLDGKETL